MTTYQNLKVEREGSLGLITLNRAEARNPLDRVTAEEFVTAFEEHLADDAVRSIVVSGAGDAFCAGGDLRQMREFGKMSPEEAFGWPEPIVAAHKLMLRAGKPVIAAVNGPAFAGGFGLAGMCDVVIAVRDAKFAAPEVKVGLFPAIIVAHLARSVPRKMLWEMMLTGDPIDAEEAHRLGFVNRVVADRAELDATVREYAAKFERVSPSAVRIGRRAFALMADMPADHALDAALFMNVPLFLGEDLQEGATAFLEKRSPGWADQPTPSDRSER
jgi:enoyl-CoA hydratase/carnithine racemase